MILLNPAILPDFLWVTALFYTNLQPAVLYLKIKKASNKKNSKLKTENRKLSPTFAVRKK